MFDDRSGCVARNLIDVAHRLGFRRRDLGLGCREFAGEIGLDGAALDLGLGREPDMRLLGQSLGARFGVGESHLIIRGGAVGFFAFCVGQADIAVDLAAAAFQNALDTGHGDFRHQQVKHPKCQNEPNQQRRKIGGLERRKGARSFRCLRHFRARRMAVLSAICHYSVPSAVTGFSTNSALFLRPFDHVHKKDCVFFAKAA